MHNIEYGRSLVEMIAVLVLVGLLSIVSVVGYSYAMAKYQANLLINDIQIRRVDLIAQSIASKNLSSQMWVGEKSKYIFDEVGIDDDGMISFSVSTVEQDVCEIVFDELTKQIGRIDINSVVAKSLSDCSETNKMTFYFYANNGDNDCISDICFDTSEEPIMYYCGDDIKCGMCQVCDTENGNCRFLEDGIACDEGKGICLSGDCTYNGCSDNSDCQSDEYCSGSDLETCQQMPFKCKKVDFSKIKLKFSDNHVEAWFISRTQITYWDAKSACAKIGKKLVSVDELVDNYPSEMILPRDERLVLLHDELGDINLWTNEEYNRCYSISVFSRNGYTVNQINTTKGRRFALCR